MDRVAGPGIPSRSPIDAPAEGAPPRRVGVIVAAVVILLTLALGAVLVGAQLPGDGLPRNPAGSPAPGFALQSLDGGSLALADVNDGPVLVTFWASWCATCKSDMPKLRRLAASWESRGVRVVGVVIEDTLPAAIEVAEEQQLNFPSVLDVTGDVKVAYGVAGTPETFLVDADGVVVTKWVGPLPHHDVEFQLGLATG
jgi:peroxiredoxin